MERMNFMTLKDSGLITEAVETKEGKEVAFKGFNQNQNRSQRIGGEIKNEVSDRAVVVFQDAKGL